MRASQGARGLEITHAVRSTRPDGSPRLAFEPIASDVAYSDATISTLKTFVVDDGRAGVVEA